MSKYCFLNERPLPTSVMFSYLPFEVPTGVSSVKLKSDSHFPNKFVLFTSLKALKSDEKRFSFHLKSSFLSEDI